MSQSPGTHHSYRRILTVTAIIATAALFALVGTLVLLGDNPWAPGGPGPSSFAPSSIARTAPGSVGCRVTPGNICYVAEIDSSFSNLPASNLFFAVSNASELSYPVSSTVALGAGATVSWVNATTVEGVWSFRLEAWSVVPSGVLPTTSPIDVVLDTGLASNATFVGSYFFVEHSRPYGGWVGFPLS
jgi:hypothetical protein